MATQLKQIPGGITVVRGILTSGISCGIKEGGKLDLALIYSEKLCKAQGMFTKNKIKSASILVTKQHLKNNKLQAIIINSGNANTATGEDGIKHAIKIIEIIATKLNIPTQNIGICSTGVIGKPLPVDKIIKKIDALIKNLSKDNTKAAEAILTTDKKTKEVAYEVIIDNKPVYIGGMAKGAGMICPNLATMLAFIATDCNIKQSLLRKAFRECVDETFNKINIDGCTSTNDSVILLANGLANNKKITQEETNFLKFKEVLLETCRNLAKKITEDAEGASKLIKIKITRAPSKKVAHKIAYAISQSLLIRADLWDDYIGHPGRFLQTIGSCGVKIIPSLISVYIDEKLIIKEGRVITFDDLKLNKSVEIKIDIGLGDQEIEIFTTDLSPEYIKLNK